MNCIFCAALFLAQTQVMEVPSAHQEMTRKRITAEMAGGSRSIMVIDPKERASDYLKAFELLKLEKSTAKVFFVLADGSKISNVIDMRMMPSSTLVVFRYTTPQGIKFEVVEIENVVGIMHQ